MKNRSDKLDRGDVRSFIFSETLNQNIKKYV